MTGMKNVFEKNHIQMKTIKLFLLSFCIVCGLSTVQAQSLEVPTNIVAALDAGNAGQLSAYLNDNVELVIGNQNDVFSKQQASGIIADFFRKNRVTDFQILHKGNKDAASFAIGTLKTSEGNYRVYVLTRKQGAAALIQQLRIESSNE